MLLRFRILFYIIIISFLLGCADSAKPLIVMTFNIRYDSPDDGENSWVNRRDLVTSMIDFHKADVVGLQEALRWQIDYIAMNLPDYNWVGVGRDDGKNDGEFSAIFYRKSRFVKIADSTFWCSGTPDRSGLGWDAVRNRIVTWAEFEDNLTYNRFFLFNTHFDHVGKIAKINSAKLLLKMIETIAQGRPVIVTGDFNSDPYSEAYEILTNLRENKHIKLIDTQKISKHRHHGPDGTFNGFNVSVDPKGPIDFIFVGYGMEVLYHGTLSETFNGRFPSDHFPVLAEIIIN